MDDLSFLSPLLGADDGSSNAILRAQLPDGTVRHVSDSISVYRLLDSCPLLYHAFEFGHQTRLQASIEAPSKSAAIALLRYCYTDNYLPFQVELAPIGFLLHAETCKLAEDFDCTILQLQAHSDFSYQINAACSLPEPPEDLIDTISFVYRHFSSHKARQEINLLSTLLNYCISVFESQKLGGNENFLELARRIPEFRQDLCRTNMERNFEDDCAFAIVRLALDALPPYSTTFPTLLASRDLPQEMLIDRPETPRPHIKMEDDDPFHRAVDSFAPSRMTVADMLRLSPAEVAGPSYQHYPTTPLPEVLSAQLFRPLALPYRPRAEPPEAASGFETDSPSDDDSYSVISRTEEPMSSPELVPTNPSTPRVRFADTPEVISTTPSNSRQPIDLLALTGSPYPSDDEWDLI